MSTLKASLSPLTLLLGARVHVDTDSKRVSLSAGEAQYAGVIADALAHPVKAAVPRKADRLRAVGNKRPRARALQISC